MDSLVGSVSLSTYCLIKHRISDFFIVHREWQPSINTSVLFLVVDEEMLAQIFSFELGFGLVYRYFEGIPSGGSIVSVSGEGQTRSPILLFASVLCIEFDRI